jgi:SAM-dependent methyltransferase
MRHLPRLVRRLVFPGSCAVCALAGRPKTIYVETGPWARDDLHCRRCGSIPRHRALAIVMEQVRPGWRDLVIHESSPTDGGLSRVVADAAPGYSSSQFLEDVPPGEVRDGIRCEDLAHLTFEDQSLDMLLTQDVLEHVMEPFLVLDEIRRVLRPGGVHLATFPWYPQLATTRLRAEQDQGSGDVRYLCEPQYHGSPVGDGRALVTVDWGADLHTIAADHDLALEIHKLDQDRAHGIDGEFREVFVFTRI